MTKMEAVSTSETSVNLHETKEHSILEGNNSPTHRRENLTSQEEFSLRNSCPLRWSNFSYEISGSHGDECED
jgi:hypothetical protein